MFNNPKQKLNTITDMEVSADETNTIMKFSKNSDISS